MSASLVINAITEAFVQEVLASEAIKLLVGSINELTARNKELSERLDTLSAAQDKTDALIREVSLRFGTDVDLSRSLKLLDQLEEEGVDSRIEDYLDHNLGDKVEEILSKTSIVEGAVESALDNATISISCR